MLQHRDCEAPRAKADVDVPRYVQAQPHTHGLLGESLTRRTQTHRELNKQHRFEQDAGENVENCPKIASRCFLVKPQSLTKTERRQRQCGSEG